MHFYSTGVWFSIAGGFASYSASEAVMLLLNAAPKSLTYGEASVLIQSLILFIFTAVINLINTWHNIPVQCVNTATVILQVRTTNLTDFQILWDGNMLDHSDASDLYVGGPWVQSWMVYSTIMTDVS
jgi:hypothetical protein